MLPDSIHALEYELRYSINEYKNKLDEAQRLIRLTASEMEKDEQKMGNKVGGFLLELVGWNDAQRIVSEYDPVTGEKLSFGDRLLAGGFLALSLLPPAKAVGIAGKTVIKGVDAGIPALAKTPEVLKKIRNVLDPKKIQQAFRSVYDQVVNAPIALTKVWFDTIKKEIGEIRLPKITQEVYAGIGAAERTVKDAFTDAKDLFQRIKNTKLIELDVSEVGGATRGTGNKSKIDIGKTDIDVLRKKWNVPETETVAVGKTDVKGLENLTFEGGSPKVRKEAGLPDLDEVMPDRNIKAPGNNPLFTRHAEEGVLNEFDSAVIKAGIKPEDVSGTLKLHQSNPSGVCRKCYQGLANDKVPPGVLKQLSLKYPYLKIEVTSEIDESVKVTGKLNLMIKNGKYIN